jgi:hypothetical protein
MLRKPLSLLIALPVILSACTNGTTDKDTDVQDTDADTDVNDPDSLVDPVVVIGPAAPTTVDDLLAQVSNPVDGATYTWAWTVNGAAQTDLRAETVPAARTARGDVWCANVVVAKGALTAGPVSSCATIVNSPPVATVDLTPDAPTSGDNLVAIPSSTDADGDVVSYTYAWTYKLDGVTVPITLNDTTVIASSLEKGQEWTVTIVPNDGFDDGAPATDTVTILNSAPVVPEGGATISPTDPTTNSTLTANVSATDPDGDNGLRYTYAWYVNDPTTPLVGSTQTTLNGAKFDKGDEVWFTVIVTDGETPSVAFESEHVIILDTAPSIDSVEMTPNVAQRATVFTCTPSGWLDIDGDLEGYHYAWTVDGAVVAGQTASTFGGGFVKGQTVGCIAVPFDGELEGTSQSSNTVIIGNTPPVIDSATLSSLAPGLADTISVRLNNPHDADGDAPITYTYQWYVRGTPVPAPEGNGATLAGVFAPGDRVLVQVTPSDGFDLGPATTSNTAVVGNHKPTADSLVLTPLPFRTDDTITATATGSDVDGHTVTFSYRWRVNDVPVQTGLSNRLDGSWFVKGDRVEVNATPNDGYENGLPRTAGPYVVANTPPVLGAVSLGPNNATEVSTLTCAPSAFTDADNDTPVYTYAWKVNDTTVPGTASTLTGASFGRGDQVRCTVTPSDGTATGPAVSSGLVSIANSKPTLASVTLSPASPRTGDTITFTPVGAADVDGDTVTFLTDWLVAGVLVAQGPSLPSTKYGVGQTVQARVSPTDGSLTGTAVLSNEVVVGNTAPVITSFTVSPTNPSTQDTLVTSLAAADADDDTLTPTYAWTVNGSVVPGVTSANFPASGLARADVVSVEVSVEDGHGGTATASAGPVTVKNTPPTIASVAITPANPTETSVLTCVVTDVVDVDGDTTTTAIEWRVNGTVSGTAATLSGSSFRRGDGVTCSAIARDAGGASPSISSDPVIIENTPPTLASADISDPAPTRGSLLLINAGATADVDGDTVSLLVDWYINDVLFTTASSLLTGFVRGDTVKAVVTPTDGITPGAPITTATVTVLNSLPQVLSVGIGPTNPTVASTLVANVVSSDADADALTLNYEWYVGGSVVQSGTSGTLAPGGFANGSQVRVVVTADDGLDTSAPISSGTITIGNAAPTITGVTISPSPIVESSTPTCTATGWNDIDGDPEGYQYKWKINGVSRSVNPSINGLLYRRGDTIVCEVTPYDGKAYGTPVESAPSVVQNAAPTLVGVGLSNTGPREGDTVSLFQAGITDPDGDTVTSSVRWFVNDVQVLTGPLLTGAYFNKGDTLRAVLDLSDGTTTASFPTDTGVAVNTVPRVTTLAVGPSTPTVLNDLVATYSVVDPDPVDTTTLTWVWKVDGSTVSGAATSTLTAGIARKHQSVVASLTPSDGVSTGLTISAPAVVVLNSQPTVGTVEIAVPATRADPVMCAANGVLDADGDSVAVSYGWEISGTPGPGGTPLIPVFYRRGDVLVCKGTPSDGEAYGAMVVSAPVTVQNSLPTVTAVLLSDDPVLESSLLGANLIGQSDADDDIVTADYAWLVNGVQVSTETQLAGTHFTRGDTVQVQVVLSDGIGSSPVYESAVATVANTPPQIIGAPDITPNPAKTNDTLTGIADYLDADGDSVTLRWAWYVNDVPVQNGANGTLAGTQFSRGDEVYAWVFPSDGFVEGTGMKTYVANIENTAPTTPTVSVSPARPVPQVDSVVCSVANPSTDADGDPISYVFVWTIDGVNSGAATTVGSVSTLPASAVDATALIFCQAYGTDGTANSTISASAVASARNGILQDCLTLHGLGEDTDGYYGVDDDGPAGSAPPYEVYCDQTFLGGGWTRVMRTTGSNANFGQDTYQIVSTYVSARASEGVYEAFGAYRKFSDLLIRAVSGPQAGEYAAFKVDSGQLTMLEMLEACRDETPAPSDDALFNYIRTVGHTSFFTSRRYAGGLTIKRAADSSVAPAEYFFLCGVNTSSDNDLSYMAFADSPGSLNDWGDAWRGQAQLGTIWSFANADYYSVSSHHIGNGAMEAYAGWKGEVGSPAEAWHSATYEIYLR